MDELLKCFFLLGQNVMSTIQSTPDEWMDSHLHKWIHTCCVFVPLRGYNWPKGFVNTVKKRLTFSFVNVIFYQGPLKKMKKLSISQFVQVFFAKVVGFFFLTDYNVTIHLYKTNSKIAPSVVLWIIMGSSEEDSGGLHPWRTHTPKNEQIDKPQSYVRTFMDW